MHLQRDRKTQQLLAVNRMCKLNTFLLSQHIKIPLEVGQTKHLHRTVTTAQPRAKDLLCAELYLFDLLMYGLQTVQDKASS